MPLVAREVLIPLVDAGGAGGLCRIAAEGRLPPPHPARLDPALSELLEAGLYRAGQQARAGARRLRLPGSGLLAPPRVALAVANPGDLAGLSAENAASAELGLALALLLYLCQARPGVVLASGALAPGDEDPDVPVRPVHHLGAKLSLIPAHFAQTGAAAPPRLLLLPAQDPDGVAVTRRYEREIARLAALGIETRPVTSLRGAAELLGATRLRRRPAERWLRGGLAAAAMAGLLAALGWQQIERPIPLTFAPAALDGGRIVDTPFRASLQETGGLALLPGCRAGELPAYRAGDLLAFRVKAGEADDALGRLLGYRGLLAAVSVESGVKLLPLAEGGRIEPGSLVAQLLPVRGPAEDNLVVLLLRRGRLPDAGALERRLRERLAPLGPAERLSSARGLLQQAAPGSLTYLFRSETGPEACP